MRCPICLLTMNGPELMLEHLTTQHNLAKRRAQFLTEKLVSWRRGDLDPVLFPKVINRARSNPAGPRPAP